MDLRLPLEQQPHLVLAPEALGVGRLLVELRSRGGLRLAGGRGAFADLRPPAIDHDHRQARSQGASGGVELRGQRQGREGGHVLVTLGDALLADGAGQPLDLLDGYRQPGEPVQQFGGSGEGRGGDAGVVEARARPVAEEAARRRLGAAAGAALNYFAAHKDRLGYAARLARGQAIGSGLVEATIKQLVNLRMKRTGARWRVKHVGPFVELLGLADSAEWSEHWASLAA